MVPSHASHTPGRAGPRRLGRMRGLMHSLGDMWSIWAWFCVLAARPRGEVCEEGCLHGETRMLEHVHSTARSSSRRRLVCLKAVREGGLCGGVHHQPACDFSITVDGLPCAVERTARLMHCQIEVHAEVLRHFDSCSLTWHSQCLSGGGGSLNSTCRLCLKLFGLPSQTDVTELPPPT